MRRFIFLSFLLAAACRPVEPSDFVLRVAVPGPLEPFSTSVGNSYMIAAQDLVFDTFLMADEQGTPVSRVLQKWERIDGRHYRIQLNPGLRFSDGTLASNDDAVVSLAVQKLRGTVNGEWLEVESLAAGGLVEPTLLNTILFKQTATGPLGTASFRFVSESSAGIVLDRIRPAPRRIARVEILAYPSPREVLARVIRGDTNAALSLDERQLELLDGIERLKPIRGLSQTAVSVIFNSHRLDIATRRRLAQALPIRDIAGVFADGCRAEAPAGAPVRHQPPPPGRRLEVLVPQMTVSMDRAALAVRRALGTRGGEVIRVELSELAVRMKAGAFDLIVAPLVTWPSASIADAWRTGAPFNFVKYSNSRVNAAFEKGDFAAAKAELLADVAFVEICRRERIGVVDSRIKNPRMGWWGLLDTLPDWEVEE